MLFRKILDKILTPLFISIFSILIGFFLKTKRKNLAKYFFLFGIIFLYLSSIFPFANILLSSLENKYSLPQNHSGASFVVLLVGGKRGDSPLFYSSLSLSTLQRTICLAEFYKKQNLNLPIIISGREPFQNSQEGAKVKELLLLFGIPKKNIFLEESSRTTKESAKNLKKIVKDKKTLLFTSAFHLPRAVLYFKKEKVNVVPFPCDFRQKRKFSFFDFFPRFQALENSTLALREYFGILAFYLGF